MRNVTFDTPFLQQCIERWRTGDNDAANELIPLVSVRLETLARSMFQRYFKFYNSAETEDILQMSLIKLLRTLHQLRPANTREFFKLATVHIRRELLELIRKKRRRVTVSLEVGRESSSQRAEALENLPDDLDRWSLFHQAVDRLPVEEREVLGLVFYHGWTQHRIAELFHVHVRTIRRRWSAACLHMQMMVGADFLDN
jgi:RNA polymerase sigma-70 factor (ECF subfamily)